MNYKKRIQKLVQGLSDGIDCIAITTLPNLRYFFDYAGQSYERFSCGLVNKDGSKSALVIPALDLGKSEKSTVDNVFSWTDSEGFENALTCAMTSIKSEAKIVVCEDSITFQRMEEFKAVAHTKKFLSITDQISNLRLIKDQEEMDLITDSAKRLAKGYKAIPEILSAGKTEAEVGFAIKKLLSEQGLKSIDFCAVQSGRNSAIPHSETTPKKIQKGDMVVIDISCTNEAGYFADFTRTYSIGPPSSEQRKVYDVVKNAQAKGVESSSSRTSTQLVDRETRSIIDKAGYSQYFVHRTGHGLGLEVHEAPFLREGNKMTLAPGMVFTIEPGIYLPGKFGVRIEDNIAIGKKRSVNLTELSHELVEI